MEFDLKKVIKSGKIANELDYQRVLVFNRKLRLKVQEEPELEALRRKLLVLLKEYQEEHWKDYAAVTDEAVEESDLAEAIAEKERAFTKRRKQLILQKLDDLKMNQQDLGLILGHRKSYTSELMNGLRPFSMKDVVILNQILKLELDDLVPTILSTQVRREVAQSIEKLNKPELEKNISLVAPDH